MNSHVHLGNFSRTCVFHFLTSYLLEDVCRLFEWVNATWNEIFSPILVSTCIFSVSVTSPLLQPNNNFVEKIFSSAWPGSLSSLIICQLCNCKITSCFISSATDFTLHINDDCWWSFSFFFSFHSFYLFLLPLSCEHEQIFVRLEIFSSLINASLFWTTNCERDEFTYFFL